MNEYYSRWYDKDPVLSMSMRTLANSDDASQKAHFREMATIAVQEYMRENSIVSFAGKAEALAIWPEILPNEGVIEPLDAFEIIK